MFSAEFESVGKIDSPKNVPDRDPAPRFLQSRSVPFCFPRKQTRDNSFCYRSWSFGTLRRTNRRT